MTDILDLTRLVLLAALCSATLPLAMLLFFRPSNRKDLGLAALTSLLAGTVGGLVYARFDTDLAPAGFVFAGCIAAAAFLPWLFLGLCFDWIERKRTEELEMAQRIPAFALANILRLDIEGEDYLSVWTLNEVLRTDTWTAEEQRLIKYMIDNIDKIGHVVGHMSAPAPYSSAHATLLVYNINRADLQNYGARVRAKYAPRRSIWGFGNIPS